MTTSPVPAESQTQNLRGRSLDESFPDNTESLL